MIPPRAASRCFNPYPAHRPDVASLWVSWQFSSKSRPVGVFTLSRVGVGPFWFFRRCPEARRAWRMSCEFVRNSAAVRNSIGRWVGGWGLGGVRMRVVRAEALGMLPARSAVGMWSVEGSFGRPGISLALWRSCIGGWRGFSVALRGSARDVRSRAALRLRGPVGRRSGLLGWACTTWRGQL